MEYTPVKSNGSWFGLVLGIIIFGFFIWGISYSLGPNDVVLKIMLYLPLFIGLIIYAINLIGSFTLKYRVDEKAFKIKWGFKTVTIPYDEINEIAEIQGECSMFSVIGMSWYGYKMGLYVIKKMGSTWIYATRTDRNLIVIKTNKANYTISPEDLSISRLIAEKAQKEVEILNLAETEDDFGKSASDEKLFSLLYKLNIALLFIFAIYLAIFFPGSNAPHTIIILAVLTLAIFFFNTSNARRLFNFSAAGAYVLLVIGMLVSVVFLGITIKLVGF